MNFLLFESPVYYQYTNFTLLIYAHRDECEISLQQFSAKESRVNNTNKFRKENNSKSFVHV